MSNKELKKVKVLSGSYRTRTGVVLVTTGAKQFRDLVKVQLSERIIEGGKKQKAEILFFSPSQLEEI